MVLATQNSFISNNHLDSEIYQNESNIISNPTVSPVLTTLRLANNTPMSDVTFSYTPSSNGQIIPPENLSLVSDIRPGGQSSYPDAFAIVGNELFFAANDGTHGEELWKSDGTANGTVLVKDIRPGSGGSGINNPIVVGNTMFFKANDGVHGTELWKSDGTANGTVLVKDIHNTSNSGIDMMAPLGNKIFFKADDGIHGSEPWVSDGTPSGTYMLKDMRVGTAGSSVAYSIYFDGKVYFRGYNSTYGSEIWHTDGTTNGTQLFKDVRSGQAGNSMGPMIVADDRFYFKARGQYGTTLFVSDGTANGTQEVMMPNGTTDQYGSIDVLAAAGSNLFFSAWGGTAASGDRYTGQELWFTNGTENGTIKMDLLPGNKTDNTTRHSGPKNAVYHPHDGHLYFLAWADDGLTNGVDSNGDNITGVKLWRSNGTLNGTHIIDPGLAKPGWKGKHVSIISAGLYVYASLYTPNETDRHWYRTDGTDNGTIQLCQANTTQSCVTHPDKAEMAMVDGTLYFEACICNNGNTGSELYSIKNSTGIIAEVAWSVYPSLPSGLSINSTNGKISGTPDTIQSSTQYTVWANSSLESASAIVDIEIVGAPEFSYEPSEYNLQRLHQMPDATPMLIGGVVESWEINPDLPSGLNFDLSNGKISGTPTVNQNITTYSVWGNNSAGSHTFSVTIKVSEEPPNIVYQDPSRVATQYIRMDDINPISNGGLITSWEISPTLPLGLFFNNGTITGTPAVNQSEVSYTVWANNSEGSDSDVITIEIEEPPLGIVISQSELILVENIQMDSVSLIYIGDQVDTWELDGDLPPGLMFETTNLTIYGTPTQIGNQLNVTIWANTSLMSDSVFVPIDILLDTDGDSMADDFGSLSPSFLVEDDDDDNDGISDSVEQSSNPSTDSLLADTDGDGVCDGQIDVTYGENNICTSGYDYFPTDPAADADTDGDGYPDVIRSEYNTTLIADEDDDGDGLSDVNETLAISQSSPLLADTDGDGICDGFIDVTIREEFICDAGPDAFPNDSAAYMDTDSDGKPDDLFGVSSTGLAIDHDDDGDQSSDLAEMENGTDPKDPLDFPTDDNDGDGWTNSQELFCGTDKEDPSSRPIDFDLDKWCDADDPDDDNDNWDDSMEKDCGTDPRDSSDTPKDDDRDGICNGLEVDESFPWWILPLFLFVALIVAGYIRMGRLSKQMSEVIATSQLTDATDTVWDEEDEDLEDSN
jgi:ELWxxDGT repeat protein